MFLIYISLFLLIKISSISNVERCAEENQDGDNNTLLSPVELMDLVLNEERQMRFESPLPLRSPVTTATSDDHLRNMRKAHELFSEPKNSDGVSQSPLIAMEGAAAAGGHEHAVDPLSGRKVWSRWSKWGECSVSCGAGTIARRRVCVAGRCADGEREEQRRPCARAPCLGAAPLEDDEPQQAE